MSDSQTLDLAGLLREASRTFAVGIEALPSRLRDSVRLAYLLLRISDYLEDDPVLSVQAKAEGLEIWNEVLSGARPAGDLAARIGQPVSDTPDAAVACEAVRVFEALSAIDPQHRMVIVDYVRRSTRGMHRWVLRGPRFATEEDLDDYMYQVAGLVGLLLSELFALHSGAMRRRRAEMSEQAVEFGLGLQTVNVIRGLSKDVERGWIYVPESLAAEAGVSREALFAPGNRPQALAILDRLVGKAERHLEGAMRFIELIPRREMGVRIFCILPLLFAVRTLALSRGNAAVFDGEVKMSRAEVLRLVRRTRLLGWSNRWVRSEARRLARTP